MKEMKSIYDIGLHESTSLIGAGLRIVRVPGGWLYTPVGSVQPSTFVPFNNEFMDKTKKDLREQSTNP